MTKRAGWNWGPKGESIPAGRPDKLDFRVITNETTAANLLLTGGLDIANIGGPDEQRPRQDKTIDAQLTGSFAPYIIQPTYYWFSKKGSFSYVGVGVVLDPVTVVRVK